MEPKSLKSLGNKGVHVRGERRAKIRQRWSEGVQAWKVAKEFRVTARTVYRHVKDLPRPQKRIDEEKLRELVERGLSWAEIARQLDASEPGVHHAAKRLNLTKEPWPRTPGGFCRPKRQPNSDERTNEAVS